MLENINGLSVFYNYRQRFTNKRRTMKEEIAKMYAQALYDDLPPNVFADQVLRLFDVVGSALLSDLMKEQQEIISSPIRFNGVHIDKVKQVFEKNGIKYDVGF